MDIIQAVLENKGRRLESDVVLADIVSKLDGYVAVDIENVIDKAAHLAITDSGSDLKDFVPLFHHNEIFFTI